MGDEEFRLPSETDTTDMKLMLHGLSLTMARIAQEIALGHSDPSVPGTTDSENLLERVNEFQIEFLRANKGFAEDILDDIEEGRAGYFGSLDPETLRKVIIEEVDPDDIQDSSPGFY